MTRQSSLDREMHLPTVRDLVTPIFRHKRAGIATALVVLAATTLLVLRSPKQYEAELKLLVKRERADTIVSADASAAAPGRTEVSEDELNSEVALLKSRDLLEQVGRASGLIPDAEGSGQTEGEDASIAALRVVQALQQSIVVAPLKKTTLIRVAYRSTDPTRSARVLTELARLYLEKHLILHRPPGAYQFFSEQAERLRGELTLAEDRLKEFGRRERVVSADVERDATLHQLAQFEAALQQTREQIADADRRLAELESLQATTPARQTTQIRTSDNAQLTADLKSKVLELEMKRTEMLQKFTPAYPPVVDLEGQLAQARAALDRTEQAPLTEQTTDQNPTHQWVRSELARVKTERVASIARTSAIVDSIRVYRERARQLEEQAGVQQSLKRAMKNAEESYQLYLRKQEEARISDALDRTRIANVTVAEPPTVPLLPSSSGRFWMLILGALMSIVLGLGVTYLLDYITPYFHTPDDVQNTLDVPVLVTLQARR